MNKFRFHITALSATALLCGAQTQTQAQTQAKAPTPQQIYAHERADCLAGRTQEDRPTCLKEAGAALAQARHGAFGQSGTPSSRAANAEQRCDLVRPEDKLACLRMVRGEGTVSGSVASGGILREIVTPVDAASSANSASAAASSAMK